MNIALIEVKHPGDNKDYNNGFGTTFEIKKSFRSMILKKVRLYFENFPTLSYAYISAIFKKYNHSVRYYQNTIPENADIAIINCTAIRFTEEKKIINQLKQKKIFVIVYGAMPTSVPQLYKDSDLLIIGQYELIFEKIAKSNKLIKGIVNGKQMKNLNLLPFPDWDIFNINDFSYAPLLPGKPFVFIQSSQGCPYSCSYCPHRMDMIYKKRYVKNIIKELIYLRDKYKVKRVHFRDSFFCLTDEEINDFEKLYLENKLEIKWSIETRADYLTKERIKALFAAGLRGVKIGVESASSYQLKKYNRTLNDFHHIENIIKFCRKLGIKTNACYIIGFPNEKKEEIEETIRLSKKINSSFANFFIFTPLPDTDFVLKNNLKIIDKKWEHRDNFHLVFKHNNFDSEELREIQKRAITKYYFRIKWIIFYIKEKLLNI